MPGLRALSHVVRCGLPVLVSAGGLTAQTCLVLSPSPGAQGNTSSFELALYSSPGKGPSAIQWTFQYPASSVSSLAVDDGPVLTAAGKAALCAGNGVAFTCLAVGANEKTIGDGVIAKITATLASGAASASIQIANPRAASPGGEQVPISALILPAGAKVPANCRLHPEPRGAGAGK